MNMLRSYGNPMQTSKFIISDNNYDALIPGRLYCKSLPSVISTNCECFNSKISYYPHRVCDLELIADDAHCTTIQQKK